MSVKGSWTRVACRSKYERQKKRIYTSTEDLEKSWRERVERLGGPHENLDKFGLEIWNEEPPWTQAAFAHDKRRQLIRMHIDLDLKEFGEWA